MNRVELIGRLAKDAELKKIPSGTSMAKFTVATDHYRKGKDKQAEKTVDYVPCVAWYNAADFIGQYGKKGDLVSVEGRATTRSYEDTATQRKVYKTEICADTINILSHAKAVEPEKEYTKEDTGPDVEISSDDLPF